MTRVQPNPTANPAAAAGVSATARPAPGDEAPAGTPGTGETVCPRCGGTGKIDSKGDRASADCPECEGSGKVIVGIGGA